MFKHVLYKAVKLKAIVYIPFYTHVSLCECSDINPAKDIKFETKQPPVARHVEPTCNSISERTDDMKFKDPQSGKDKCRERAIPTKPPQKWSTKLTISS